jgi:hypothetical protein
MAANVKEDGKELKDLTIRELRTTRNDMLRRENWMAASEAGVPAFRSYVRTLNDIQSAIRDLEKAQLKKALQEMKSLESDLRAGIKDLKEARQRIQRTEDFVAATGKVLDLVAKAVKAVV